MTADNRTNGQIVAKALVAHCEEHKMPFPRGSIKKIVEALRDAGRLAGEPTEAQVEAAAKAIADCHNPGMFERYPENWRVEARAALVAAQGAAPVPSSGVDEDALAEMIESIIRENWEMFDDRRHQAQVIARAVAEWLAGKEKNDG